MANANAGIDLMKATFRGKMGDQAYKVTFMVRLNIDGPLSVTASQVHRMIMQKRTGSKVPLLRYEGDGKYIIDTTQLTPK